jgi:CheY-like chemotaxis protein
MLAEILRPLVYRCDLAGTGAEAQRLLMGRDYDVILCDLRMPDIDGGALYAWIEGVRPHLCARTVFVTGDTLGQATSDVLARSNRPVIEKPFLPETVRQLVLAMQTG